MGKVPPIEFPFDVDWRCWIERWDRMQDRYLLRRRERFELMVRLIADTQGSVLRVLDLGCGTGSLMLRVLEEFLDARVCGIDYDPTLLVLGAKRLTEFGERARLIEGDLRDESWLDAVPEPIDAAVSATALHWLSPKLLARLYGQLAKVIRPGGVFLNADHVGSDSEKVQKAWEQSRERMRRQQADADADDWDGFWRGYGQALKIDVKQYRAQLTEPWEGSEEGLPLEWHFERLRASGFEAVDCFWRLDCDAVYGGIRGRK